MEDKNSSGPALAFVCGFLVGITAGAAAAVILAPQAGHETRQIIGSRAAETYETLGKRVAEVKQMASDLAGDLKEDVGEWAQKTKERMGPAVEKARNKVEGALSNKGGESVSTN